MGKFSAQLYRLIEEYALADRHPQFAQLKFVLEQGMISDNMAKAYLISAQESAQRAEDYPNYLHRPPTEEQLNNEGKPDIEIGNLIEGEQQRFGIRLRKGSVPCILAAGTRGGGKSNLIRAIIHQVEALNVQEDQEADKPDRN